MTFNGVQIPEILNSYAFKQTPNQVMKNVFEVEGIEFCTWFITGHPDSVQGIIEGQRQRKFAKGGMSGGTKTIPPEAIIPLDKLTDKSTGKHLRIILSVLYSCMTNANYSTAYYCSKAIPDIKAKFVKVLKDLYINEDMYDAHSVENDIRFANGSRLVFAQAIAFGDHHVVAPDEPKPFSHGVSYIGVDLARSMADYTRNAKCTHGKWGAYNP